MITALIANPITLESEIKRPSTKRLSAKPVTRERTTRNTESLPTAQVLDNSNREEEAYIVKTIFWFFVLLILPAILTLLYITVNPDTFMIDISPKIDFSTWQPGTRP